MDIMVNRNDVGSMPPGSCGVSTSTVDTAPVTGSMFCTISPFPSKHLRQLVCARPSSARSLQSSGWSRELLCHAYLVAMPSTRNGMNTWWHDAGDGSAPRSATKEKSGRYSVMKSDADRIVVEGGSGAPWLPPGRRRSWRSHTGTSPRARASAQPGSSSPSRARRALSW